MLRESHPGPGEFILPGAFIHKFHGSNTTKKLTSVCQMPCKWPGTFGHGGAWGTQCWIDPAAGAAYLLFVQRNNFGASTSERPGLRQQNADNTPARADFQAAAAKAVRLNKL